MIDLSLVKRLSGPGGAFDLAVDIYVEAKGFTAIYGPSGSGKTSLLRMIAGLLRPDGGYIKVDHVPWFDGEAKRSLRPQLRDVGVVFQDYALFPNMSVEQNIAYGAGGRAGSSVAGLVEMMELGDLRKRMPATLSGGQKQRVALARALARRPKVLLLDEPLSAIDTTLRIRLQDLLRTAHDELGLTTILVSHDMIELVRIADRVITIDHGKVTGEGAPREILPIDKLIRSISGLRDPL